MVTRQRPAEEGAEIELAKSLVDVDGMLPLHRFLTTEGLGGEVMGTHPSQFITMGRRY